MLGEREYLRFRMSLWLESGDDEPGDLARLRLRYASEDELLDREYLRPRCDRVHSLSDEEKDGDRPR